jgi:hypothetical protein
MARKNPHIVRSALSEGTLVRLASDTRSAGKDHADYRLHPLQNYPLYGQHGRAGGQDEWTRKPGWPTSSCRSLHFHELTSLLDSTRSYSFQL